VVVFILNTVYNTAQCTCSLNSTATEKRAEAKTEGLGLITDAEDRKYFWKHGLINALKLLMYAR